LRATSFDSAAARPRSGRTESIMPILDLAEMTSADVRALDRERACVVLSVSPVEEHGPHLPLGTDILESEAVARRLCEKVAAARPDTTFLFHPPIPIGSDTFHDVGSIEVRPSTIRAVLRAIPL